MKRYVAFLGLVMFAAVACAGEAEVKRAWESAFTNMKVESVTKTDYLGLYEVYAEGEVFYTDEKVTAILRGDLIDAKTRKNLTQEKKFSMLPLDQAIKVVRGNGKNVLVTFEDPNCGYCKKLARELQQVKNTTVYTFLVPILSEDSVQKSKAIWCAADKSKTWSDWMLNGTAPIAAAAKCDAGPMLAKTMELSRRLGIRGTPFLYFANGQQAGGYIPAAEIEKRLGQSAGLD